MGSCNQKLSRRPLFQPECTLQPESLVICFGGQSNAQYNKDSPQKIQILQSPWAVTPRVESAQPGTIKVEAREQNCWQQPMKPTQNSERPSFNHFGLILRQNGRGKNSS